MYIILKPMGVVVLMASFTALASLAIHSTGPKPLPPITAPLLTPDVDQCSVIAFAPAQATHTFVPDPNTPNAAKRYLHTVITRIDPNKAWSLQIERTVDVDVPAGQNLVLRVIARSSTNNPIGVYFLRNGADYDDDFAQGVALTPEWKTYTFPFTTSRTYLSKSVDGGAAVALHIGQRTGTVDLAALQVVPADEAPAAEPS